MGLPTPLCFVQIALGDFGNPDNIICHCGEGELVIRGFALGMRKNIAS